MNTRTVKAWCVCSGSGWPFLDTVAPRRGAAIDAYETTCGPGESFASERIRYGVQIVRCTVTTEPKP